MARGSSNVEERGFEWLRGPTMTEWLPEAEHYWFSHRPHYWPRRSGTEQGKKWNQGHLGIYHHQMLQSQLFAPVSLFLPFLRGVSVSQHGQSASSGIPQQAMSSFKPAVRHLCPETSAAQAYDAGGNIQWSTCVRALCTQISNGLWAINSTTS